MAKPIIVAICGKSATGKDHLVYWLKRVSENWEVKANFPISDTTRPPREKEVSGIHYNFISKEQFLINIQEKKYLEHTEFKEWLYGTPWNSIQEDAINVMIVNPEGLKQLAQHEHLLVIPIYLEESFFTRMRRSYRREHKWKKEYLRRAAADWKAFLGIKKYIKTFPFYLFFDECTPGVVQKTQWIVWALDAWNLTPGKKQ